MSGVVDIPLAGRPIRPEYPSKVGEERGSDSPDLMDRFVVGPENLMAVTAVEAILDGREPAFNPIVFHGPSGVGKTHLAMGMALAWKKRYRRRAVERVTAVDFARELAEAIETKLTADFARRYRKTSLLVVEDIQHLSGKDAAQRELLATTDTIAQAGGRNVLTASIPPWELKKYHPMLVARLIGGLTVPLVLPGPEARLAVLLRLVGHRKMAIEPPVLEQLAVGVVGTVPALAGALNQLVITAGLENRLIDHDLVAQYLDTAWKPAEPTMPEITRAAARYFSVRMGDMRSPSRQRKLVTARDTAMFLIRQLTGASFQQIGRYFGGRDHKTVWHGCQKIRERLNTDVEIQQAIEQLQRKLGNT